MTLEEMMHAALGGEPVKAHLAKAAKHLQPPAVPRVVVSRPVESVIALHSGQQCPVCGAGHWWKLSDKAGWHCAQCETPPKVEGLITTWTAFPAPTTVELKRVLSVHPPVLRCGVRTSEVLTHAEPSDYCDLLNRRVIEWFAQSLLLRGKVKRADSH